MKQKRRYRSNEAGTQPPTSTSAKNHATSRTKMRKKLRAKGHSEEEVADIIEQMWFQQDCARLGVEAARQLRYDRQHEPDDRNFKPPRYDPLLNGPGRATGETAKAVKSRKAIVK